MLRSLDHSKLAQMKQALTSEGLPAADLSEDSLAFCLEDPSGIIGWAVLEKHGPDALLRSVLVLPQRRGTGSGTDLVREMIAAASRTGVHRLWLLTNTAAPFFERLGFKFVDRAQAPDAIRRTSEFRETCPASATCMTLDLADQPNS
jgi:amino-acid N-acetyltransferase